MLVHSPLLGPLSWQAAAAAGEIDAAGGAPLAQPAAVALALEGLAGRLATQGT